ncbi:unnamed protein product [Dicrocoelium dendriticum]|nr:unnamed protein product [Dicrocoelium dendriticum]
MSAAIFCQLRLEKCSCQMTMGLSETTWQYPAKYKLVFSLIYVQPMKMRHSLLFRSGLNVPTNMPTCILVYLNKTTCIDLKDLNRLIYLIRKFIAAHNNMPSGILREGRSKSSELRSEDKFINASSMEGAIYDGTSAFMASQQVKVAWVHLQFSCTSTKRGSFLCSNL